MDDCTEKEINKKSTSDKRKQRIAHVPKFHLPIVINPITSETAIESKLKIDPKRKQVRI